MAGRPSIYRCSRCGEEHQELEPGFRRPDALFAVPKEQRAARVRESDDLCAIDGRVHFLRAVAPFHVQGRDETYQWGLWVRVSKESFDDYLRLWDVAPPEGHAGYEATVANQSAIVPPLLGTSVRVALGALGKRPELRFADERHLLGRLQREGIGQEQVVDWSSKAMHPHQPQAPGEPFVASLAAHGWTLLPPAEVGRPAQVFEEPPGSHDFVKAAFRFLAADAAGDVAERIELMWIELDAPPQGGRLTGTLANHPMVPGPLDAGTRIHLDLAHCLAHEPTPTH